MKTKARKQEELAKARGLFEKGGSLLFADFSKIGTEDARKLRMELKKNGAALLVVKKRLLGILFKEKGIAGADLSRFKVSVGTLFSPKGTEAAAGTAYKFFAGLEVPEGGDKNMWVSHLLGGYDLSANMPVDAATIAMIGKLPPREALLGQLLGMIAAPIRSLLYVLNERAKSAGAGAGTAPAAAE